MAGRLVSWRAFISVGTIVSGVLMAALWSLEYDWASGIYLVLLLYAHEIGHVLAAHWRHVRVDRAPMFIPGLGAFVVVGQARSIWDQALVALGGPVFGSLMALGAKLVGLKTGNVPLAFAGSLGLWINLLNLVPIAPFDGGRAVAGVGWLGLLPSVMLAGLGLWRDSSLLFGIGVVAGGLFVYTNLKFRHAVKRIKWSTRLITLGAYLAALVVIGAAALFTGLVYGVRPVRVPWLGYFRNYGLILFLLTAYLPRVHRWAFTPGQSALIRYLTLTFLTWPNALFRNPWFLPVPWMALGQILGLPGIKALERFIRFRAPADDTAAGFAIAVGYDCLSQQDRPQEARDWLERMIPVGHTGGAWVMQAAYGDLFLMGYREEARHIMRLETGRGYDPNQVSDSVANNIAWQLYLDGRFQEALPYVRAMTRGDILHPAHSDTVGRVLLETGQIAEAEHYLRDSLAASTDAGTRVVLARTLAAQGRHPEAIGEAERALYEHKGPWPDDEPNVGQVKAWIGEWHEAKVAAGSRVAVE